MSSLAEVWDSVYSYLEEDQVWVVWTLGISAVTFFGSLIAVPFFVIQLDENYFLGADTERVSLSPLRLSGRIAKNILGYLLVLAGIAMLVLPGQGLLTIALGVGLVDFPGKRSLQIRIVSIDKVGRSINWIRKKADRPPIKIPKRAS